MTGASIKIDFDGLEDLKQITDNLGRKFSSSKALMLSIAATLRSRTQDRFATKTTPDGKKWTSKLVKSGNLRGKLQIAADDKTAIVGSNLVYAAIHQFGGDITAKNAKVLAFNIGGKMVFAKKVKIKANPYLGIDQADEAAMGETVKDYFEEGIRP